MAQKESRYELIVEDLEKKVRVDSYIANNIEELNRTQVGSKSTTIYVDGKKVKNSAKVFNNQKIEITCVQDIFEGLKKEDIDLDVIYEDSSMLVINKEQGLVVHPGAGNYEHTIVNALLHRYGEDFTNNFNIAEEEDNEDEEVYSFDLLRPGIVHRLDKDTSGTMVIARTRESYDSLVNQFKNHTTQKSYIAIVKGFFTKRRGRITTNICRDPKDRKKFITCEEDKGKTADTSYVVLKQYKNYALLRINIYTGRTHQIRVHLSSINHPVLGDPIYSKGDKKFPDSTLMLHAIQLQVDHPLSGERMRFNSKMPKRFKTVLYSLNPYKKEKGLEEKYYESAEKMIKH